MSKHQFRQEENIIIRFVKFKSGLPDQEILKLFYERAPQYRKLSGLIQKYYYKEKQTGEYRGIYFWDSMQSMQEFQQSELSRSLPEVYKIIGQPRIEILDVVYSLRSEEQK